MACKSICSVVGCVNQHKSLHCPPAGLNEDMRARWMDFIFNGNVPPPHMSKKRLSVCAHHFTLESFSNLGQYQSRFATKLYLKPDAIPTIRVPFKTSSSLQDNTHSQGYSTPPLVKVEEADQLFLQYQRTRDVGCQTVRSVHSVGTQLSKNSLVYQRSKASQATVLTVSVAIGTPVQRPPPIQSSTFRKPFKPSKRRGLKQDDHGVFTESSLPGEPVVMSSQASTPLNDVPKYLVDEYCLLELFEDCPACGFMCEVHKTTNGTFLAVHQMCLQCNFSRNWKSQQLEAVPLDDPGSSTNDPESSVAAITEIIGCSDENDSSSEESIEVDEGEHNSDSDWDPLEHHCESDADEKREEDCHRLCPECGAFFYNQTTHSCENKKPYSCNVCGKRFLYEAKLKAHSKIHEVGYEHACKYCFTTFRTSTDKLVHEQSHLPAERPYQCPDCPEVFARMRERTDHLVIHRGIKRHICQICNMEFSSDQKLQRHVVVHTKVKQFVCEVCQRSFNQSTHLKSHMRVHTGEKPYQCQHCDKSFNHNVSLKSHIQRYHGQVPDPGEKVQMEQTNRNVSEVEKDETNEMESSDVDAEEPKTDDMEISGVDAEEAKTDETGSSGVDTDAAESSNTWVTKKKTYKCKSRGRLKKNEHGCDEEKKERAGKRKRCTGRPIGRPKKNAVIISDDANQLNTLMCYSGQGKGDSTDEGQEHDSDPSFEQSKS